MRFILDTNVMLLLIIGATNQSWINQHKNMISRRFELKHYFQLVDIIQSTDRIATTSNILTEVSNLLSQTDGKKALEIRKKFAEVVSVISEIHLPGKLVINNPFFLRYGLTDALVLLLEKADYHILSVDSPLCYACATVGLPYTNLTPLFFESF